MVRQAIVILLQPIFSTILRDALKTLYRICNTIACQNSNTLYLIMWSGKDKSVSFIMLIVTEESQWEALSTFLKIDIREINTRATDDGIQVDGAKNVGHRNIYYGIVYVPSKCSGAATMRSALLRGAPTRTPFAERGFNGTLSIRSWTRGFALSVRSVLFGEMSNGITSNARCELTKRAGAK